MDRFWSAFLFEAAVKLVSACGYTPDPRRAVANGGGVAEVWRLMARPSTATLDALATPTESL